MVHIFMADTLISQSCRTSLMYRHEGELINHSSINTSTVICSYELLSTFVYLQNDDVYPVGPIFDASSMILNGKFKWLRGIVIGDIIFGLPCHADCILRIDTNTDECSVIEIPYEDYFDNEGGNDSAAHQERYRGWKYHGGSISPHDGCIYAIPQSAKRVLRIDPKAEECSFVGPEFEGRCKWYGGVVGKTDGAIYGIPQNAMGVLRIDASGVNFEDGDKNAPERVLVTIHGEFQVGGHKWHGAAAAEDGTIVSVREYSHLCVSIATMILCLILDLFVSLHFQLRMPIQCYASFQH